VDRCPLSVAFVTGLMPTQGKIKKTPPRAL
jgi:hypothetical protein